MARWPHDLVDGSVNTFAKLDSLAARGRSASGLRDPEEATTETQRRREYQGVLGVSVSLWPSALCLAGRVDFHHGLLVRVRRRGRDGRERHHRPGVGHAVLIQLFDARHIRAEQRVGGDHDRLMTIADVISPQSPFGGRMGLDHEHRLRPLNHRDDSRLRIEHQIVAGAQNAASGQRQAEVDAAVASPPTVTLQAILPSERDGVARVAARAGPGSSDSRWTRSTTVIDNSQLSGSQLSLETLLKTGSTAAPAAARPPVRR